MNPAFDAAQAVARPTATDQPARGSTVPGNAADDSFDLLLASVSHPGSRPPRSASQSDPSSASAARKPVKTRPARRTEDPDGSGQAWMGGAASQGIQRNPAFFAGPGTPQPTTAISPAGVSQEPGEGSGAEAQIPALDPSGPESVAVTEAQESTQEAALGFQSPDPNPVDGGQPGVPPESPGSPQPAEVPVPLLSRSPIVDPCALAGTTPEALQLPAAWDRTATPEVGKVPGTPATVFPEAVDALPVAAPEAPLAGTGSAPSDSLMNGPAPITSLSGLDGQELPADAEALAALESAAERAGGDRKAESEQDSELFQHASDFMPAAPRSPAASHPLLPVVELPPMPAVDRASRIAGLVEAAVVRLRRTGSGEFEVAIRPDSTTEICLRISMKDGSPEVHAELRRGDAAGFQAHWHDLQQRLSDQGIRVAPLGSESAGMRAGLDHGNGSRSRQQDQGSSAQPAPSSSRDAGATRQLTSPRSIPNRPTPGRSWETWA